MCDQNRNPPLWTLTQSLLPPTHDLALFPRQEILDAKIFVVLELEHTRARRVVGVDLNDITALVDHTTRLLKRRGTPEHPVGLSTGPPKGKNPTDLPLKPCSLLFAPSSHDASSTT